MHIKHRQAKILLIGEEVDFVKNIKKYLHDNLFLVRSIAPEKRRKIDLAEILRVDAVVVTSNQQKSLEAISCIEQIRSYCQSIPIFIIVRYGSEKKAVAALRSGVTDYFSDSYVTDDLVSSIKNHLHDMTSVFELYGRRKKGEETGPDLVGISKQIKKIRSYLLQVAALDSTVLITGETGTGKELAANFIYWHSKRRNNPFVRITSSAMPEQLLESEFSGQQKGAFPGADSANPGKFEMADKGTLFLDEIGEMSAAAQAEILGILERKRIHRPGSCKATDLDVRVIAATNQDIERRVKDGKFRKDLFFRLNVVRLHMPPLRERREDIPVLLYRFMLEFNESFGLDITGFSEKSWFCLLKYEWPGNIRELRNVMEAIYINHPFSTITFQDLPVPFQEKFYSRGFKPKNERDKVLSALFAADWNKSQAAQDLNCSRMTLYRKMAKHQIVRKRSMRTQFFDLQCDA